MNKKNKSKMHSFDIFSKLPDEMVEGTTYGTIISIIVVLLIISLAFSEYNLFYRTNLMVSTEMILDDTNYQNQKIQINFDISISKMACEVISLDSQDAMGSHHINNGDIYKQPIDKDGNNVRNLIHSNKQSETAHDENFSAQLDMGQLKKSMNDGEGCRIYGNMKVNRVPGNFHISSHAFGGFLGMILGEEFKMNLDHKVNKLWFSNPGSEEQEYLHQSRREKARQAGYDYEYNPLENVECLKEGEGEDNELPTKFSYHEHIVDDDQFVYQYVVNRNQIKSHMLPAIYIKYEISSIAMKYNFTNQELSHFLIEIFAIIGGIFTLAGLLDSLISSFVKTKSSYINVPL